MRSQPEGMTEMRGNAQMRKKQPEKATSKVTTTNTTWMGAPKK